MKLWNLGKQELDQNSKVAFIKVNQIFRIVNHHQYFPLKRRNLLQDQVSDWEAVLFLLSVFRLAKNLEKQGVVRYQSVVENSQEDLTVCDATNVEEYVTTWQKIPFIDVLQSLSCQTWFANAW